MLTIIGALFPVFGLIVLGFACGWSGYLLADADEVLSQFVARITLPVLAFRVIATSNPADLFRPAMLAAAVGAPAIVWSALFLFERWRGADAASAHTAAFGSCFGNHGFVGLPVCLALIGPASMAPTAVIIALTSSFLFGWGVFMQVLTAQGRHVLAGGQALAALRIVARQIATNPLVLLSIAGAGWASLHIPLPGAIETLLVTLGDATGPCALVAIGLFLARPLQDVASGAALRGVLSKLVLLPAVTFGVLSLLQPLPPVWLATTLLMAAMPTGSGAFVIASQAGPRQMQLSASLVVFSVAGAAVTLPLLISLLQTAGVLHP
ncbi:MAG: AEC family transporter [Sphingomonadales bacterium]|nr:AEC family transporter [Sphingomonadales bacterium]